MANRTNELTDRRGSSTDPDVIRTEIAQTRAEMGQTIHEIQERLSPKRLKQQTQEKIREATIGKVEDMTHRAEHEVRNWRTKLVHTVKENPVPAALIGVGLGWLILADNNNEYDYPENNYPTRYRSRYIERTDETQRDLGDLAHDGRERVNEAAEEARERVNTAVHQVQNRVNEAAESVQESASSARRQLQQTAHETRHQAEETAAQLQTSVQQGVRRTKRTFWQTMNENPLAVGATAVAVGALVGMALPSTSVEDRWLGERRDELLDETKERVQQQAQQTARKVQAVASETKDAAVETAKEEADKKGLRPATVNGQSNG